MTRRTTAASRFVSAGALSLLAVSCNGTTGYDLVSFYAAARGPADAVKGQPYTFDANGQHVTLTQATLHVGALYLTQAVPTSGGGAAPCTLPGTYDGVFVGEVRGGGDVDLLDPSVQALQATGDGSTIPATTGQVWLMHGDVNAPTDTPILYLQGSVEFDGSRHGFSASVTIGPNLQSSPPPTSLPGEDPICLLRIVQGIPVDLTVAQSGTLALRLDPKALFVNVDFSRLPSCGANLCFSPDASDQPTVNLFKNLTSAGELYRFEWLSSPPPPP